MSRPDPSRSGRARVIALALVGLLVAGGLAWLAGLDLGLGGGELAALEGAPVRRGPLRITVVERANLEAANSVKLKSELEGRSTILWLIPEGTWVEPGDLVCELDVSSLVERRVQQEIEVRNAEAAHVKASQVLKIQESQNLSDSKKAEQDLDFARRDLRKFEEAEAPQELQQANEAILLAEQDLRRKEDSLEWSDRLHEKGFLTRTQLEADRFAHESARVTLEQEQRNQRLLEEYDHPRRRLELQAAIDEAERELERVKLQAEARMADYRADLEASEARLQLERDELAKLEQQIEKAKIRTPVAGMVVYSTDDRGRWGDDEPIQEGTEVRERQEIVTIPSSEGMVAEMSLHESVLEKVREGMPCIVRADALPGRTYRGRVRFKSTLPDQNSWWANPDLRVYRTEIEVLDVDPDLKSGMSCSVEIVVDQIPDALHVPVQSIFLDGGRTVVFAREGGAVRKRPVEVGLDDGKWVHVQDGLEEGEVVLLSQPPGSSLAPVDDEELQPDGPPDAPGAEGRPAAARSAEGGRERASEGGGRSEASGRGDDRGAARGEGGRPTLAGSR